jgi:hypothetical protein
VANRNFLFDSLDDHDAQPVQSDNTSSRNFSRELPDPSSSPDQVLKEHSGIVILSRLARIAIFKLPNHSSILDIVALIAVVITLMILITTAMLSMLAYIAVAVAGTATLAVQEV